MKKKVSGNTKSLIISLFAVLSCLTASHASAQTARVTIGMRQVKMEQVMNEIEKKAITLETAKLTTDENAVLIVSKLISDCRKEISVSLNDTWVSGNEKK